ncbi:hypothetical protein GSI_03259 [Ganoderma sinense ZZ0214-1]|uniref:Uncharacterized protein n=1 Tax=Ganoderma sinense ZZ0214-1 TaxID=1077348 RepID=A0A2G8SL40_9APHY|nr:hypothetical protein GSI_03259 [Ganoderma sinense ZZ0214-1]
MEGDGVDLVSLGKKYGYLPDAAENLDFDIPSCGDILAYDWRKDAEGQWDVEMGGGTALKWAGDYGQFSYQVAGRLDDRLSWGWDTARN